jgi:hypothetical protein
MNKKRIDGKESLPEPASEVPGDGLLSWTVCRIRKIKGGTGTGQIFAEKKKHLPNYQ